MDERRMECLLSNVVCQRRKSLDGYLELFC